MKHLHLILFLITAGCAGNKPAEPEQDDRIEILRSKFEAVKEEALQLRDPVNGWLTPTDCDGLLWTGKYAAVTGVDGVDITAAEVEPGRFVRRPAPHCTSDNPMWSDTSKDMFAGLAAYAWRKKDLALLERHIAYCKAHQAVMDDVPVCQMGKPLGDGRGVYYPATVGRLHQIIYGLGGPESVNRLWPDFYPEGLTDYKAHMQVMNIWVRGEVEEVLREGDARPRNDVEDDAGGSGAKIFGLVDVSDKQLDRLKEHAARDPRDPFFQAVASIYSGDYTPAFDALLAEDMYPGEYVRCDNYRQCQVAAWLFAADIVLRRYD